MPRGDLAPKISLAGVGKTFVTRDREVEALQPIDLAILDHEFVALVGPSGCGKSTILNLIAGLLQPSGGVVSYDGMAVSELNRQGRYMTQKDTLLPWRTAADNIRIAVELKCRAVPPAAVPVSRWDALASVTDISRSPTRREDARRARQSPAFPAPTVAEARADRPAPVRAPGPAARRA